MVSPEFPLLVGKDDESKVWKLKTLPPEFK